MIPIATTNEVREKPKATAKEVPEAERPIATTMDQEYNMLFFVSVLSVLSLFIYFLIFSFSS